MRQTESRLLKSTVEAVNPHVRDEGLRLNEVVMWLGSESFWTGGPRTVPLHLCTGRRLREDMERKRPSAGQGRSPPQHYVGTLISDFLLSDL